MRTSSNSAPPLHADSTTLLDVDNVTVAFGSEPVLSDISFCLHKGEFVGIIGPNGAGKTTLLKVVLGLQKPTTGVIKRPDQLRIGYVPQRGASYQGSVPISVLEVVRLGSAKGSYTKAMEALRRVHMESCAKHTFSTLSGGQQQRVSIAKALAGDADLLILDEPTTGVDEQTQSTFYALLAALQQQGVTIIMVSHEVDTVLRLVTRVICLNRVIVYDGSPEHFEAEQYLPGLHNKQHVQLHHHHEQIGGHHA